jgi:gliding motility-associated-like protein
MSDKLKKFIQEHRNEMDVHTPSAEVWSALNKQLAKPSLIKALAQKGTWKLLLAAATIPAAIIIYTLSADKPRENKVEINSTTYTKQISLKNTQTPLLEEKKEIATNVNTSNKEPKSDNNIDPVSEIELTAPKQQNSFVYYNPDRLSVGNGMIDFYTAARPKPEQQSAITTPSESASFNITPVITHLKCAGDRSGKIDISSFANKGAYTFNWSLGNKTSEDISGLSAGTYTLSVTDAQGHNATFAYTITEPAALTLSASSSPAHCNMNDGTVAINTGSTNQFSYLWSNGKTDATLNNLRNGTYIVTATDSKGCTAKTSTTVENTNALSIKFTSSPSAPLKVDFTNNSVDLTSNVSSETMWVWKFGDGQSAFNNNTNHTYAQPGTYHACLIAKNLSGCIDSLCNDIEVNSDLYVTVPNIFTPNGDGKNDDFTITSKGIQKIEMTVYDQQFVKVFEMTGASAAWDGRTSTGKEVPDGTYYYSIKAYGSDNKLHDYKGFLTVNR